MSLFFRFDSSALRRRSLLLGPVLLAFTLASLFPVVSIASGADESSPSPHPERQSSEAEPDAGRASSAEAVSRSGMLVFVDPETGELTEPTPEQEARMRGRVADPGPLRLNKSSQGLVPFALEDGGRGVFLERRFRSALRVQVLEDGSFQIRCSDHPEQPAGHEHTATRPAAEPENDPAPES